MLPAHHLSLTQSVCTPNHWCIHLITYLPTHPGINSLICLFHQHQVPDVLVHVLTITGAKCRCPQLQSGASQLTWICAAWCWYTHASVHGMIYSNNSYTLVFCCSQNSDSCNSTHVATSPVRGKYCKKSQSEAKVTMQLCSAIAEAGPGCRDW